MKEELEYYDKLGEAFLHFKYRERYGWSFEQYIRYVEEGTLQQILGQA